MHASVAVGTLMAGVAKLCTARAFFSAPRILSDIYAERTGAEIFFPPSFVRLTAGSRRGSAMTCYHSDRQAAR